MANAGEILAAESSRSNLVGESIWITIQRLRNNDECCLAPKFKEASENFLTGVQSDGHDIISFECCRSNELAEIYYKQGASKAPNAFRTWHFYGLARDFISESRQWKVFPHNEIMVTTSGKKVNRWNAGDVEFQKSMRLWATRLKLKLGMDWTNFQDYPHVYWGRCKPTPSNRAIELYKKSGIELVQREVGAWKIT